MAKDDALKQRLAFLEEERRKDHGLILALQERLVALEGDYRAASTQLKELQSDIAKVNASLGRIDQVEAAIARVEQSAARNLEEAEQRLQQLVRESERTQHEDLEALRHRLGEIRKRLEDLAAAERTLEQVGKEIGELRRSTQALEKRLESVEHVEEDRQRAFRLLQETQDRNAKRLVDLQGEVLAFRKKLEEQRAQSQVFGETLRKVDERLQEVMALENRRKQEQKDFLEAQNRRWLAWERTWKAWEERFESLESLSQQVEERLRGWDDLQRAVRRAQQDFEDMTERMERRINEITEVQRLSEERFRQEWTTFKADDQKRWANYVLAQDERGQDVERRLARLTEQFAQLQDGLQALDDVVKMGDEQVRKRLQALATLAQEWVNEYERLTGVLKDL